MNQPDPAKSGPHTARIRQEQDRERAIEGQIVALEARRTKRTKLTDRVEIEIVKHVMKGTPFDSACRLAGIDPRTGQRWLAWGRAILALRAGERVDVATLPEGRLPHKAVRFARFAGAVEHALAQDEANRVARISQTAAGGAVVGRRAVETTHKDGRVTVTTDERYAPPAWAADAWMLERTRRQRWGRISAGRSGDDDGPSFVEVVEMVWDKLRGHDPRKALGGVAEDRTSGGSGPAPEGVPADTVKAPEAGSGRAEDGEWVTLDHAAAIAGQPAAAIYRRTRRGGLPWRRRDTDGRVLVLASALLEER